MHKSSLLTESKRHSCILLSKGYILISLLVLSWAGACTLADHGREEPVQLFASEIQTLDSLAVVLNENFSFELFDEVINQTRSLTRSDSLSPLYAYGLMYEAWFNATFQRYEQAEQLFAAGFEKSSTFGLWQLEVEMAPAAVFMFVNLTEQERARQIYERLLVLNVAHDFDQRQQNLFKTAQATWYRSQNQIAEALELYLEAIAWFEAQDEQFYISSIYNSIGLVLTQTSNYEDALEWFNRALERQQEFRDVENIDRTLNNMGYAYRMLGEYDRAIETLNMARQINEENGRNLSVIRNLYNIGQSYTRLRAWDEALATFRQGYDLSTDHNLKPGIAFHLFGIATVYYERGDSAEQALSVLLELADVLERNNMRTNALNTYRMLYSLEQQAGNPEAALNWFTLYHEQVLLSNAEERKLAIENVLIQNQLEREMAENQHLRDTIELKRQAEFSFILIMLVLLLLTVAAFGFVMFYRYSTTELQNVNKQLLAQSDSISAKNQQLEELALERQRLINVIIHDLRNPLSVIESLQELIDPDDPEGYKEMKDILLQSAVKMRQIVNSLLTVFEAESADIANEMQLTDIEAHIHATVKEFAPLAAQKKMEIKCDTEPVSAVTHPGSLSSIVSNLVSNAIKYSYPDSVITIEVKKQSDSWVLKVRDQGQGFMESERTKVFGLFAKLSSKPTGNENSTGVGLFSVRLTTEKLGGRAALNWEYKDGAEFICTFPLNISEQVVG